MRQLRALIVVMLLAVTASAAAGGYTIRWGDTLSGIAQRLGIGTSDLATANRITDPNRIRAGEILSVPQGKKTVALGATNGIFQVVKAGDNLATLAKRFGTTPSAIASANGLADGNWLQVGQRLLIPGQKWLCPVKSNGGPVSATNGFGAPRPGGHSHEGDDIFAATGTPVVAPVSGVVRRVQGNIGGNAFYLAGDDGTTYYGAHMSSYAGSPGRVSAGTVIGTVGQTGDASTTPPHLHFEIHPNGGAAVDPWPVVSRAC
jgi:murein DD-endopeptidase MepM/ murein hydrolase activator NlpD